MGCLHRISFISFSIWWKGLFTTLFWYGSTLFWHGSPFGIMAFIALCFLGKLVKSGLLIFMERSYWYISTLTEFKKAPLFHQSLGPRVFLSFSFSLSLYFWLIPWSAKAGCITQGILASFLLSLSYRRLWTTRFWSIKGPQQIMLLIVLSWGENAPLWADPGEAGPDGYAAACDWGEGTPCPQSLCSQTGQTTTPNWLTLLGLENRTQRNPKEWLDRSLPAYYHFYLKLCTINIDNADVY